MKQFARNNDESYGHEDVGSNKQDVRIGQQKTIIIEPAPMSSVSTSSLESRSRIEELRQDYRRRHMERNGRYPVDEREEMYEQRIKEYERVSNFFNFFNDFYLS